MADNFERLIDERRASLRVSRVPQQTYEEQRKKHTETARDRLRSELDPVDNALQQAIAWMQKQGIKPTIVDYVVEPGHRRTGPIYEDIEYLRDRQNPFAWIIEKTVLAGDSSFRVPRKYTKREIVGERVVSETPNLTSSRELWPVRFKIPSIEKNYGPELEHIPGPGGGVYQRSSGPGRTTYTGGASVAFATQAGVNGFVYGYPGPNWYDPPVVGFISPRGLIDEDDEYTRTDYRLLSANDLTAPQVVDCAPIPTAEMIVDALAGLAEERQL